MDPELSTSEPRPTLHPNAAPGRDDGPQKRAGDTLGLWSMILGIVSLVLAFFALNLLTAIAALVLGVIALTRSTGRWFAIIGVATAGASAVLGTLMLLFVWVPLALAVGILAVFTPVLSSIVDDDNSPMPPSTSPPAAVAQPFSTTEIETSCFAFDGPDHFSVISVNDSTDTCEIHLELRGELENGAVTAPGDGPVNGAITVDPIEPDELTAPDRVAVLSDLVSYVETSGHVLDSATEIVAIDEIDLDGMDAVLFELTTVGDPEQQRWVVAAEAPYDYPLTVGSTEFFVISIASAEGSAQRVTDELVTSWGWLELDDEPIPCACLPPAEGP